MNFSFNPGSFRGNALTILLFILIHHGFAGNIITVNSSGNSGAGSLRDAIVNLASSGDTIVFNTSLFGDTIRLTSEILIDKNITISGLGDDSTIISGNGTSRIFLIDAGDSVNLEKLTLTRGFAPDSGGAIKNGGILTIRFCTLKNNRAGKGGAILNQSSLSLESSDFIANNATAGYGGAIFSPSGSINVTGSAFYNNSSAQAGAAIATKGAATINNSIFDSNSSSQGGGIYGTASLVINSSTFTYNTAMGENGGAIYSSGNTKISTSVFENNSVSNNTFSGGAIYSTGILSVSSSTIRTNTSNGKGGGISNNGTMTILNSTLNNNMASKNGGAITNSGTALINYSTISNNFSSLSGGGIENISKITINRSTIAFNQSGSNGGGIYSSDTLKFKNTIISNNSAQQGPEIYTNGGATLSQGYNLVKNNAQSGSPTSGFIPAAGDIIGTATLPVDALLGALQDNGGLTFTHEPRCGSPAIDAGDTIGAPANDQRGKPRVYGAGIDIGSVETQFDPVEITAVITDASTVGSTDGSIQLQVTGGTAPYTYLWNTGSESNILNNLAKGSYSVTVKDFFECEATGIYTVGGPNGIFQAASAAMSVYPVPANSFIILDNQVHSSSDIQISITDVCGKTIDTTAFQLLQNGKIKIAIDELPPGLYTIVLKSGSEKKSGRFLKME